MHAAYLFLMNLQTARLPDQACMTIAEMRFEEMFDKRLDSNNWYETMALLLADRPMIMRREADERSAHDLMDEQARAGEIFREWIGKSWRYNAADILLKSEHIDLASLPLHDQKRARKEFVDRVSAYAALLAADPSKNPYSRDAEYMEWTLRNLKRFVTSARNSRIGGFTLAKRATPYDWRCFDLRTSTKAEPNAILIVDIHT